MLYPSLLQLPAVEGKPGKNLPPMHPFCRSTTLAVLPSEEELDKAFEDFKADNIPEGMDFDEWLDGLGPTEDGKLVFRDKSSKATVSESKSDIGVVKGNPLGNSDRYLGFTGGKRVDKSRESGIIGAEVYFRKSDSTNSEFRPISQKRFNALTIEARKNGAHIIKNDPQFNKRLRENDASAVTYGDTIIFGENVTLSDILEETHHFMQNKIGLNSDKPDRLRIILNEIDAKQYLLDNAKKYHIPRNETELTRKQLLSYQKQAKEFSGG